MNDFDRTRTLQSADPDATTAPAADVVPDDWPDAATRVGRYAVYESVRRWRHGTVHRAVHVGLRRLVELQLFDPEVTAADRAAFLDGIRRAAAVASPFVAAEIREVGVADGTLFVARNPAAGPVISDFRPRDRAERRRELLYPNPELAELIRDAASGLAAIHEAGLVHGAVAAERLRRDPNGRPQWHGLGEPAAGEPGNDLRDFAEAVAVLIAGPDATLRPERWAGDLFTANPGVSRRIVRLLDDIRSERISTAGAVEAAAAKLARRRLAVASWLDRANFAFADGLLATLIVALSILLPTWSPDLSNSAATFLFVQGLVAWLVAWEVLIGWTPLHRLQGMRLVDARGDRPASWRLLARTSARVTGLAIVGGVAAGTSWLALRGFGIGGELADIATTIGFLVGGLAYYLSAFAIRGKLAPHDWLTGAFWAMPPAPVEPSRRIMTESTLSAVRVGDSTEPATVASDVGGQTPDPPPVIDQYVLNGLLGQGGMGAVYRAVDPHLNRVVALKVVAGGGDHAGRFRREAQLAARIDHPHVARVYGAGTTPAGEPYMVMEHLPGLTLAQHVQRFGPCAPAVAWQWVTQAADGLRAADRLGIIHRDVKPSNLMLDDAGRVKVTDFGLSKTLGDADPESPGGVAAVPAEVHLTRTGAVLGTPMYMSPEQADGRPLDRRTDIYSLGLTLVYLLTGQPPYDTTDLRELLTLQAAELPPAVAAGIPGLTPGQQKLIRRMLAKLPAERFADYDELLAELRRTEPREPVLATWDQRVRAESLNSILLWVLQLVATAALIGIEVGEPHGVFSMITSFFFLILIPAVTVGVYVWGVGRHGSTPGKRCFRLQVRRLDGSPVGVWRAAVRFLVAYSLAWLYLVTPTAALAGWTLSKITVLYIMAVQVIGWIVSSVLIWWRPRRQALHDLIVGTIVVRLEDDQVEPRRGWRWWLPW